MDCWIGVVQERGRRSVKLAGRLGEEQVPELLAVCVAPRGLQLDLDRGSLLDLPGQPAQRIGSRPARRRSRCRELELASQWEVLEALRIRTGETGSAAL